MATKKTTAKKSTKASSAIPEIGEEVTRDLLEEMTDRELVLFARLNYGFNNITTETQTRGDLIEQLMRAARKFKGNAEMKVVEKDDKTRVPPGYVKIKVSPGAHNPSNQPIPVGLNFKNATIPVNKEIIMHEKWLPCLQDAVQTKYFVDRSDPSRETLGAREEHSYPFTILERG